MPKNGLSKRDSELIDIVTKRYSSELKEGLEGINNKLGRVLQTLYGPNFDKDIVGDTSQAVRDIVTEHKVQRRMVWSAVGTAAAAILSQLIRWLTKP